LGSAQLITNYAGEEYERLEYTPYGELWIEKSAEASVLDITYRFTGKERDEETGNYYYGARYLDPRTSRWLSTDPAVGDYVPQAGRDNKKLPNGGVYNTISFHAYNYSNNNPVKYVDPDGNNPIIAVQIARAMLPKQGDGFLYFDTNQPQYLGGYNNSYERFTSNNMVCNIDSLKINFRRVDGRMASIWLWKGDYNMVFNGGWHTGGEIGAYNGFGFGDDSIIKSASFSLEDANGNVITSRSLDGKHWINSFVKGNGDGSTNGANGDPSSMTMRGEIEFNDVKDAKRFYRSIKREAYRRFFSSMNGNGQYRVSSKRDGNKVTFEFQ
jgi:RHS repeat-associated protein